MNLVTLFFPAKTGHFAVFQPKKTPRSAATYR